MAMTETKKLRRENERLTEENAQLKRDLLDMQAFYAGLEPPRETVVLQFGGQGVLFTPTED